MSNKHITIKELNNEQSYDTLYPNTSATQVPLSDTTSQLFGQTGLNTDAALYKIIEKLRTDKKITVRVTDSNGNPVQGAKINGLLNSPTTSANGIVTGVFVSDPLTIVSPYVDIQDGTANGANYVGTMNVLDVVLQAEADNTIFRYTSSTTVKFSQAVSTVDVCCVGGGGAGGSMAFDSNYTNLACGGGGGGGIVNATNIAVTPLIDNSLIVGSGGNYKDGGYTGGNGGTSSFLNIVANGGFGGIGKIGGNGNLAGGNSGAVGCGNGGNGEQNGDNSTVSEFNDNATYYSGGGGGGSASQSGSAKTGGSPNGANGARFTLDATNAKGPGGGGGGAFGYRPGTGSTGYSAKGSSGAPGLVAIRIHLK